ncbi:hypothetical protein [Alkalilimnicola ehrlichii]|uniref:hypothetical protein n=1 Tax=Alkalilimnicola ehrlichii TaxID=351052 RepID=UPI003B9E38ED
MNRFPIERPSGLGSNEVAPIFDALLGLGVLEGRRKVITAVAESRTELAGFADSPHFEGDHLREEGRQLVGER